MLIDFIVNGISTNLAKVATILPGPTLEESSTIIHPQDTQLSFQCVDRCPSIFKDIPLADFTGDAAGNATCQISNADFASNTFVCTVEGSFSAVVGGPLYLTIVTDMGYSTTTQIAIVQGPLSLVPSSMMITNTATSITISCNNCPLQSSDITTSTFSGPGSGSLACSNIANITVNSFDCATSGQIASTGGAIDFQVESNAGTSNVVQIGTAVIGKALDMLDISLTVTCSSRSEK